MKLKEFEHLWNGNESGWVLKKLTRESWRLVFFFSPGGPNAKQVVILRQFVPELMNFSLPAVYAQLKGEPCYRTHDDYGSVDGSRLLSRAKALGFEVSHEVTDNVSYLPVRNNHAFLIEDNALAKAVVLKMIEAGVPVFDS